MQTNTVLEDNVNISCNSNEGLFDPGCSCCSHKHGQKDDHGQTQVHDEGHGHGEVTVTSVARLLAGAGVFVAAIILNVLDIGTFALAGPSLPWLSLVFILFLAAFLIIGCDILFSAVRNVLRGQVFDEQFLMSIASCGAFVIGECPEAVAVMLFYKVGEQFQDRAVDKSRKSIAALMDIRPDYANLLSAGDEAQLSLSGADYNVVSPDTLAVGNIILIKPGEKVPVDCQVITGTSTVDASALTGESLPRDVSPGEALLSGCVNLSGVIHARVLKVFGESTVSKVLDLVQNAKNKKSRSEQFITKFARYYTPVVVGIAVVLAVVPPLVFSGASFDEWVYRALLFLVVSCPCALVISIPLSFFGGIGGASKSGVLIKGGNYLESLARAESVIFDKTGTLTKGVFRVSKIVPLGGLSEDELLRIAADAESFSNHPISASLKAACGNMATGALVESAEEIAGQGVKAFIDKRQVLAGNIKLMDGAGLSDEAKCAAGEIGTVVHVAVDNRYRGYIVISDEIKADAKRAVADLKSAGVSKISMLTGDSRSTAEAVGADIGLDSVFAELLPAQKVDIAERLLGQKSAKGTLVFVGDGINDAPVLARADVGIAMGGVGSDAAIEAADVVIMTDEPSKVADAIRISRRTIAIANQNIALALGVKGLVLLLGALGVATMWEAIFADVGVSVIAILNALRALQGVKSQPVEARSIR